MDYSKSECVRLKADFLRLILQADINSARQSILVDFIESYVKLNKKEQTVFDSLVNSEIYTEVIEMMTVYKARGIEQGMQQGALTSTKQDIFEVLELKFSTILYRVKEKIKYCDDLSILKNLLRQAVLINSIDKLKLP